MPTPHVSRRGLLAAGDLWLAGGTAGSAYGLWHSTDGGASLRRNGRGVVYGDL